MIVKSWNRVRVFFTRNVLERFVYRKQFERFLLVFGGHLFFQTLNAACRFDLFSILADHGPLTCKEIADRLEIEEQPARIMLLGLVSCGLLRKSNSGYQNTQVAAQLLSHQSRRNILPYVELQDRVMYRGMPHFFEAVKSYRNVGLQEFPGSEATIYERITHEPETEQVFHDAMSVLSVQTNRLLCEFADFSNIRKIVDVGGGDGTNLISLSRRYPHLKGTVFDYPSVCEIAQQKILETGLSDRLQTVAGNAFTDAFPVDADAFLFAHFCTIWSAEKNRLLFRKSYDALPKGGSVIVFNMMQADDESGPLSAAVGSPYFLTIATGEGMLYTWREYEQWMKDAGFAKVERHVLPRDHGLIIGTK